MRIFEIKTQHEKLKQLKKFAEWSIGQLGIKKQPNIRYSNDIGEVKDNRTFGSTRSDGEVWVYVGNRNTADVMRTLVHELVHISQFERGTAFDGMGSIKEKQIEDEANALAGRIMRVYGKKHSDIYESKNLRQEESSALNSAYVIPGLPNSDFYKQYRFGVALAGAKGKKNREQEPPDLGASSTWGESMIVIGYGDGIEDIIDDALRSIGMKGSAKVLTSTKHSEESNTVAKGSPVQGFKGFN